MVHFLRRTPGCMLSGVQLLRQVLEKSSSVSSLQGSGSTAEDGGGKAVGAREKGNGAELSPGTVRPAMTLLNSLSS